MLCPSLRERRQPPWCQSGRSEVLTESLPQCAARGGFAYRRCCRSGQCQPPDRSAQAIRTTDHLHLRRPGTTRGRPATRWIRARRSALLRPRSARHRRSRLPEEEVSAVPLLSISRSDAVARWWLRHKDLGNATLGGAGPVRWNPVGSGIGAGSLTVGGGVLLSHLDPSPTGGHNKALQQTKRGRKMS